MRRLARLLVCALVAVAVPLQGVAAATMASCGPWNHHSVPSSEAAHAHPSVDHSSHGPQAHGVVHEYEAVEADASVDGASVSMCSACSACCTGAIAFAQPLVVEAIKVPALYIPLDSGSVAASESERLERPPRTSIL